MCGTVLCGVGAYPFVGVGTGLGFGGTARRAIGCGIEDGRAVGAIGGYRRTFARCRWGTGSYRSSVGDEPRATALDVGGYRRTLAGHRRRRDAAGGRRACEGGRAFVVDRVRRAAGCRARRRGSYRCRGVFRQTLFMLAGRGARVVAASVASASVAGAYAVGAARALARSSGAGTGSA